MEARWDGDCVGTHPFGCVRTESASGWIPRYLKSSKLRVLFSFFLDFLERIMLSSFCSMGVKKQTQRNYPVERKIFYSVFWKMATETLSPLKCLFAGFECMFLLIVICSVYEWHSIKTSKEKEYSFPHKKRSPSCNFKAQPTQTIYSAAQITIQTWSCKSKYEHEESDADENEWGYENGWEDGV